MKIIKKYKHESLYAIPPGETLKETLEYMEMSQKELSERTGLTPQSINRIIKGEQPITYETANIFELVTGVSASMWNNLEANYQEQKAKIKEKEKLKADIDWLKEIPVNILKKRGYVEGFRDKALLLRETLKFYGVAGIDEWKKMWTTPQVAARRSNCFDTNLGSASVWLRMGELQAQKIKCKPYDKVKFTRAIEKIRYLTKEEPNVFISKMRELSANAGVAVALIEEMPKVPWYGATKWLSSDKAMILLNLRGKTEDHFWFAFFHEAGHVLVDNKKDLYINSSKNKEDEREKKADEFAANILIPRKYDKSIRTIRSNKQLLAFAEKIKISPGIVAGRYGHLTKNWATFSKLKQKFVWTKEENL